MTATLWTSAEILEQIKQLVALLPDPDLGECAHTQTGSHVLCPLWHQSFKVIQDSSGLDVYTIRRFFN